MYVFWHKIHQQARRPLPCSHVRRREDTPETVSTGRVNWTSIWDLLFPQHLRPGWSQETPVISHGSSFPGKFPEQLPNEGRLSVFWYILDKHLLVIFIQKLEILGLPHVDSFQQLTQQPFVYQYRWLTSVDLRGCLWPRFSVKRRSSVEDPRVHAWHYQIVTQTDPRKNRYC